MIEVIPDVIDTAFLYFHTRCSSGDEIAPRVDDILPDKAAGYLTGIEKDLQGFLEP